METNALQCDNELLKPLSYYLRHKLNPGCLIELFQYLSLSDLITICELDTEDDQFFKLLINERVIGFRWIVLDFKYSPPNMYSYPKIFQVLGKSMKKMRIRVQRYYLNYILKWMIEYCAPDNLQQLHIIVKLDDVFKDQERPLPLQLLEDVVPFIRSIQTIYINVDYNILGEMCSYMKMILAYFVNKASKLQILKVVNLRMGHFFNLINVEKLRLTEIHLTDVTILKKDLRDLIRKMPDLEVFFMNISNMTAIGNVLGQSSPKLRFIGNIFIGPDNIHCYNFFRHFKHLVEISLMPQSKGIRNFKNLLEILAAKNTLCKLNLYFNDKNNFEYNRSIDLNGFPSLKHIEFHFRNFKPDLSEGKGFFQNLMTDMKALNTITLVSRPNVSNVFEIVQHVPYIGELNIFQMNCHRVEAQQILQFLQKTIQKRSGFGYLQPIHIITNLKQTSEIKKNNNIHDFIKISTKTMIENHLDAFNF